MTVRVAAVGYLNARPLWDKVPVAMPDAALSLASPREVARQLAEDEADVALMPVAAAAAFGDVEMVPGIAIGARGPVRSVVIVSQEPIASLSEIALDLSSRTSVVLGRLLLRRLGSAPKFLGMEPGEIAPQVAGSRGALIIGDAALALENKFPHVLDLGQAWFEWTGLPFVFAAWCAREGRIDRAQASLLARAKELGLEERGRLAAEYAQASGLDAASLQSYLHQSIRYDLGDAERAGLERFFLEANRENLLPRAKVRLVGDASSQVVVPEAIDSLLSRASQGERLSAAEGERLFTEASLHEVGAAADAVRARKHPEGVVTYIVDRNINYTNVCTTSCRFCAFYRPVGHAEGYVLSREVLAEKMQEVVDAGGVQILLQGGLNPNLRIEWYEDLFRWMKQTFPLGLHALSPEEIIHIGEIENLPVETVLSRLHAAGLDSVPGGGAEILVDRVRKVIAKTKCRSEAWLSVMRVAHRLGLRSSATMMYGTTDTPRDRMLHLLKLRELQDETGGFTAFFCWDYQHEQGTHILPSQTGTEHYLRMQAVARLMFDNVDHVGASWVTQGPDVGQVALRFGADDFGSVMFEENVVSSAGTTFRIDAAAIEGRIREAGFRPARRNVKYDWLTVPE